MFTRVISRDGRFVAAFETNGVCHVVSLETQQETGSVAISEDFNCLAIGSDGRELAAGFANGAVRIWDLAEGKVSWSFLAHSNQIDVLTFSPDRSWLATAARGGEVRVWDLKQKRLSLNRALGAVGYHVNDMVFAQDSALLVVPAHRKIHLVSLRSGGQYRTVEIDEAFSIDISHDGSLIAAGMEEEVRVWEVASLRQVALLRGSRGAFNAVSFSPDHHLVAGLDLADVTWLWNLATGREIGHFDPNSRLIIRGFQPNGDVVVTDRSGRFEGIRLLHAPSWKEIAAAEEKEKAETKQP